MHDNDIIQDTPKTYVPCVIVNREDFRSDREFYEKVKTWCKKRHPKVFVVDDGDNPDDDIYAMRFGLAPIEKVSFFFTTKELYLEFVKEFPQVLRGTDSES